MIQSKFTEHQLCSGLMMLAMWYGRKFMINRYDNNNNRKAKKLDCINSM